MPAYSNTREACTRWPWLAALRMPGILLISPRKIAICLPAAQSEGFSVIPSLARMSLDTTAIASMVSLSGLALQ